MIERIRITLWDVFSFFLSGFFVVAVVGGFWMYQTPADFDRLINVLSTLPASVVLVAAPLFFTLLGLLMEPFANYFDGWILKPTLGRLIVRKDRHADEEKILVAAIRKSYLGELGETITNPFHICKDYVEAKGLSQAFMILPGLASTEIAPSLLWAAESMRRLRCLALAPRLLAEWSR